MKISKVKIKAECESNVNLKPLRRLFAYILDFFVGLIIASFLFVICDLTSNSIPSVSNRSTELSKLQANLYSYVYDSKLDVETANGMKGSIDISYDYVKALTYNSLENKDDISSSIYSADFVNNIKENSKYYDNLNYYYTEFKIKNISNYSNESQANSGEEYFLKIYFEDSEISSYFESNLTYPVLKANNAKAINEYLQNSNYEVGKQIHDNLVNHYNNLLLEACDDLENNYLPYFNDFNSYTNISNELFEIRVYEVLISYIISCLLCYFVFPMCFKNGRTISYRCMQISSCTYQGYKIKWYNNLISCFMKLLCYGYIPLVIVGIIYGSQSVSLFTVVVLGFVNLFGFAIFSLLLSILSYLFSLFLRKQSFSEIVANIVLKDTREFIVTNKKDNQIKEVEDNSKGLD